MRLGPLEIGLILVIILIVFGVGKLPQVGEGLGKAIHSFRKASKGDEDESKVNAEIATAPGSELEITKAKLEAAEAKLKSMETSTRNSG